ncbi:MAG: hypothetical protein ABSE22_15860 [Xanthobacteraceae bacterium]
MQPVSYSVPQDIRATLVRALAYMGGLAILAIAAASLFRTPSAGLATIEPAPQRPEWVNVERPHPAFELQMPELAGSAPGYAILRRTTDGARKDVLSFGEAAGSGPYVMVEIYRPGSASERFIDAPSEIAARITSFTVVDDVKPAGGLDSKFGTMPLVDFAIAAQRASKVAPRSRAHRCLGFARAFDDPVMQIAGWYCSAGEEVVDRATLACALDRLTMLSAGGDTTLAGLFARAEIKRTFCGQRSPILAATPEREVPIAIPRNVKHGRSVQLRGRLSQR